MLAGAGSLIAAAAHDVGPVDALKQCVSVGRREPDEFSAKLTEIQGSRLLVEHTVDLDYLMSETPSSLAGDVTRIEHVFREGRSYLRVQSPEPSLRDENGVWWRLEKGLKITYPSLDDLRNGHELKRDADEVATREWVQDEPGGRVKYTCDTSGRISRIETVNGLLEVSYQVRAVGGVEIEHVRDISQKDAEDLLSRASASQG